MLRAGFKTDFHCSGPLAVCPSSAPVQIPRDVMLDVQYNRLSPVVEFEEVK